jgi:hypothetical protein
MLQSIGIQSLRTFSPYPTALVLSSRPLLDRVPSAGHPCFLPLSDPLTMKPIAACHVPTHPGIEMPRLDWNDGHESSVLIFTYSNAFFSCHIVDYISHSVIEKVNARLARIAEYHEANSKHAGVKAHLQRPHRAVHEEEGDTDVGLREDPVQAVAHDETCRLNDFPSVMHLSCYQMKIKVQLNITFESD